MTRNLFCSPIRGMIWGQGADPTDVRFSWSIANPKSREWTEANREWYELFQQEADQPDASQRAGDPTDDVDPGGLITVALLEASRRQESGDVAGAWDCYRSILRTITHFRRRGSMPQRFSAKGASRGLLRRLADWAADARTTLSQIHTALEEVLQNEPNPDWDRFAIKSWYLELMREIEQPMPLRARQEVEEEWTFVLDDMALSPTMIDGLEAARRFLLRAPERSRRVLWPLCAHYLTQAEIRGLPPPKPAVWAKVTFLTSTNPVTRGTIKVPLYPISPEAPAGARALPPQELARWLVITFVNWLRIRNVNQWPWPPDRVKDPRVVVDRKAHRELVIMLATVLYHRERGSLPSSDEALVGTYLKNLPDDRPPDVDDGTAPTVE